MAVARRDADQGSFYLAAGGADHTWIDFALGRYADLADHGKGDFKLWSELVLERPLSPESQAIVERDDLAGATYRLALADRPKRPQLFAITGSATSRRASRRPIWLTGSRPSARLSSPPR